MPVAKILQQGLNENNLPQPLVASTTSIIYKNESTEKKVGDLTIYASSERTTRELSSFILGQVLEILILDLVMVVTLYFVIRLLILVPLERIKMALKQLSSAGERGI